ncbi:MAG: hypothetical protein KF819_17485 [Labilithrix sp.]|nr:hypothetical protein [Labilithrix sp.]
MRCSSALALLALALTGGACTTEVVTAEGAPVAAPSKDPAEECAAGTMPSLESSACGAVGPSSCALGFATSESGWGCSAVTSAAACAGAASATLGDASCVALDDCNAAFPPPGATVVTDDASLAAALANARAGSTIALDSGTYAGFEVPRDLSIVGRCASKVILKGGGQRGVFVTDVKKVSLRSLTIEGFTAGIVASWGAEVTATKIIVRNAQLGITSGEAKVHVSKSVLEATGKSGSALNAQQGGALVFEDGEIRGYTTVSSAYDKGTELALRRSVARYEGNTPSATLFMTFSDAHNLVDESAVLFRGAVLALTGRDLPGIEATAGAKGGHLEMKRSTVRQSGVELDRPLSKIIEGGRVTWDETTLEHQSVSAVMTGDAGSLLTSKGSVIRGLAPNNGMRNAIWALRGGLAEVDGTAIVNAQENALVSANEGSRLQVTRSLVSETLPGMSMTDPEFGAAGIGLLVMDGATATFDSSAIVYSRNLAVLAAQNGQLAMSKSIVDFTRVGPEMNGGSAVASFDARVTIDGSFVRKSQDAALVFVGGDGIVKHTRFVGNPVGVHLGEAHIVDAPADPSTAAPGELVFFANVFEGTELMVRDAPYEAPPFR